VPVFIEVDRSVEVRSPVLGCFEAIGGVVVALFGDAVLAEFEAEVFFGGPEDRFGVEGVREVDQFAGEEVGWLLGCVRFDGI